MPSELTLVGRAILQGGDCRITSMADAPYLVALALVDKGGQRSLPLAGKSLSAAAAAAGDPGEDGRTLALELLLRLWQGSDEQPLRRAAGDPSLLLVELPLEVMSEQLPILKAQWIASGDTPAFLARLQAVVGRAWRITIARYEPLTFVPWP
ncbi:MAG: hypothetical protein WCQ20_12865 [Synechococcaceae cyanobacterium ELA739]